MVVEKLNTLD